MGSEMCIRDRFLGWWMWPCHWGLRFRALHRSSVFVTSLSSTTRASHKSVPHECPTRVSGKHEPQKRQECLTRVSHKSVRQECPIRVTDKSVLQECPARVSYKSDPQERPTRVFHKSVLQECPTRVSCKGVPLSTFLCARFFPCFPARPGFLLCSPCFLIRLLTRTWSSLGYRCLLPGQVSERSESSWTVSQTVEQRHSASI